jgi:hypothetical protein
VIAERRNKMISLGLARSVAKEPDAGRRPPPWFDLVGRRALARDLAHVAALPDRLLRDVGIERAEIDAALRFGRRGMRSRWAP